MLPARGARAAWRRWCLGAGAVLAACSSLPAPHTPPFQDHRVAAEFVVPADGRLVLPTSGDTLLLHELTLSPAPEREVHHADRRWFEYGPGTLVTVHARFRAWGLGGDAPANPAQILLGAERLRVLDNP